MTYLPYFEAAEGVYWGSPTSGVGEPEQDVVQLLLGEVERGLLSLGSGGHAGLGRIHPVRNVGERLTLQNSGAERG